MTVHQCPKCELRFEWVTELDQHCRDEHPQFHHDYPVRGMHHNINESAGAGGNVAEPPASGDRPQPRPS